MALWKSYVRTYNEKEKYVDNGAMPAADMKTVMVYEQALALVSWQCGMTMPMMEEKTVLEQGN